MDDVSSRRYLGIRLGFTFVALVILGVPVAWTVEEVVAIAASRPVPAVVTDVRVTTREGMRGTLFTPIVTYEYRVGGVRYVSTRLGLGPGSYSHQRQAEEAASRYRSGDSIIVYVSTRDPSSSFAQRAFYWPPAVIGGLLLIALAFFYRQAQRKVDERAAMHDQDVRRTGK